MLRFHAESVVASASTIIQIVHILERGEGLNEGHTRPVGAALGQLMRECERLDLPMTQSQLKRIKESVDDGSFGNFRTMRHQLEEVLNRLQDELSARVFYQIESEKSPYYESPENLWGERVTKAFPTAAVELSEAAKCYGLGRYTACVFHLMRALEVGLSCMAKVFAVPSDHANWHNIIEQVEAKVRELPKIRPSQWKADQEFYSQAASHFMIFKDAWRNYTAHRRGIYDEKEARRIMDNVFGFMDQLAKRLAETS